MTTLEPWQTQFPPHPDRHLLKITEEGQYSFTRERDAQLFWKTLPKLINQPIKKLTILDGTANIGSDTIRWAQHAKHVHAIEIDPTNFKALENNIKVYQLDNVTLHQGDTTKLYYRWPHDILYLDPPWGGPDYLEKESLDLSLGETPLTHLLSQVIKQKRPPKFIVLKLPKNFNFTPLHNILPPQTIIRKVYLAKFYLCVITLPKRTTTPISTPLATPLTKFSPKTTFVFAPKLTSIKKKL